VPVIKHVQTELENLSFWTMANTTHRRCGASCDFDTVCQCLTHLLTYQ